MRLFLIRHGETEHNRLKILQGYDEVPLNDVGIRQATLLGQRLADTPPDHIYSSDLRRTVMTAAIVAAFTEAPVTYEPGFRERNPGELTGKSHEEGMAFFTDPDYHPPGGESVPDFVRRVREAFEGLVNKEGDSSRTVAVVTHGMVCAAFLSVCLEKSLEEIAETSWPNAALSIAQYEHGKWTATLLGDASHLGETPDSSLHATGA